MVSVVRRLKTDHIELEKVCFVENIVFAEYFIPTKTATIYNGDGSIAKTVARTTLAKKLIGNKARCQ